MDFWIDVSYQHQKYVGYDFSIWPLNTHHIRDRDIDYYQVLQKLWPEHAKRLGCLPVTTYLYRAL